jgi:hypothetical protein
MIDFTKVPIPPSPRIVIKPAMSPREVADALQQIDLWTRQVRAVLETFRDAIIELQQAE